MCIRLQVSVRASWDPTETSGWTKTSDPRKFQPAMPHHPGWMSLEVVADGSTQPPDAGGVLADQYRIERGTGLAVGAPTTCAPSRPRASPRLKPGPTRTSPIASGRPAALHRAQGAFLTAVEPESILGEPLKHQNPCREAIADSDAGGCRWRGRDDPARAAGPTRLERETHALLVKGHKDADDNPTLFVLKGRKVLAIFAPIARRRLALRRRSCRWRPLIRGCHGKRASGRGPERGADRASRGDACARDLAKLVQVPRERLAAT